MRRRHREFSQYALQALERRVLLSSTVAIHDAVASESDGKIVFPLVRSGDRSAPLSLEYVISDRTAVSGQDFAGPFSGIVHFAAGAETASIEVPLIPDGTEFDEQFQVTLTRLPVFSAAFALSQATNADALRIVDMNDDDRPDVVFVNDTEHGGASILINKTAPDDAAPRFLPRQNVDASATTSVAVGDINGDGLPDLAVASKRTGGSDALIHLNQTLSGSDKIRFTAPTLLSGRNQPESVEMADFNGDGRLDVVTGSLSSGLRFFVNLTPVGSATPVFTEAQTIPTAEFGVNLVAADMNGDDKADLVFSSFSSVSVLLNATASGASKLSFASRVRPHSPSAGQVLAGELDHVRLPDVVTVGGDLTSFFANRTPTSSLEAVLEKVPFDPGYGFRAGVLSDFDGDGRLDMATARQKFTFDAGYRPFVTLSVRSPLDDSVFAPPLPIGEEFLGNVATMAAGDLNGDGRPDLLLGDNRQITAFMNQLEPKADGVRIDDAVAIGTIVNGEEGAEGTAGDDVVVVKYDPGSARHLAWLNVPATDAHTHVLQRGDTFRMAGGNDLIIIHDWNLPNDPRIPPLYFDGGAGNDRLVIVGTASHDSLRLYPDFVVPIFKSRLEHWRMESFGFEAGFGDNTLSLTGTSTPNFYPPLPSLPSFSGRAGQNTLSISRGSFILEHDLVSVLSNPSLRIAGAQLVIHAPQHLKLLAVENSSDVAMTSSRQAIRTDSLLMQRDGRLDLGDNALFVHRSALEVVRAQLIAGRASMGGVASGKWDGPSGIVSSTARASFKEGGIEELSIGYAVNRDLTQPHSSLFGEAVAASDLIVRMTRNGDASLDGVVNNEDVTILMGFYRPGVKGRHWHQGDFNYDGEVDNNDVVVLAGFYRPTGDPVSPLVDGSVDGTGGNGVEGEGESMVLMQQPEQQAKSVHSLFEEDPGVLH